MTRNILGAFLLLSLVGAPAYAHHSFSMFDHDKFATVNGTVKEFQWMNPHSWLTIVAADATGKTITWAFEMGAPGQNTQAGWKPDSLKAGDIISVCYHPLKDGSHGGQLLTAKGPAGQMFGQTHLVDDPSAGC